MTSVFSLILIILVPFVLVFTLAMLEPFGIVRPRVVVMSLVWGVIAFIAAYIMQRYQLSTQQTDGLSLALANAPVLEEFLKLSFLMVIYHYTLARYSGDGLVYGFAVGSGFAIMENLDYVLTVSGDTLGLALGRIVSTGMFHASLTAILGAVVCGVIFYRRWFTYPFFVFLFVFAIFAHQWFNIFAFLEAVFNDVTFSITLGVVLLLIVIGIMYFIRFREGRALAQDTPEELAGEELVLIQHGAVVLQELGLQSDRLGTEQTARLREYLMVEAQISFLNRRVIQGRGQRGNIQKLRTDLNDLRRQMRDLKQQLSPDAQVWLSEERLKFVQH